MIDQCGRNIHYLRISVTDRCNLRCGYCMPEEGVPSIPHEEILSYDEILRLVRIMAKLGIDRVRLTGGEPLVRKGVVELAREIKQVEGIRYLALTTNGVLLDEMAEDLLAAGVDGLNISLDTVDAQRYHEITRYGDWQRTFAGLNKALGLPFQSVKVNSVLSPDSLEDDWMGVVALARDHKMDVRLIEWMPMAGETDGPKAVRADEALDAITARFGPLEALPRTGDAGPAAYYRAPGFMGRIGIIPAMSHQFCSDCNRLRLTATGDLKLCLFYDVGIPLKGLLRGGAGDEEIAGAILAAVEKKPRQHGGLRQQTEADNEEDIIASPVGMSGIGG